VADSLQILIKSIYDATGVKVAEADMKRLLSVTESTGQAAQRAAGGFQSSRREFMMGQRLQGMITQTAGIDNALTRSVDGFERLQFMAQMSNMTMGQMLMKFGPMALGVASLAAAWQYASGRVAETNRQLDEMGMKQIGFVQWLKLGVLGDTSVIKVDAAKMYAKTVKDANADLSVQLQFEERIAGQINLSKQARIETLRQVEAQVEALQTQLQLEKELKKEIYRVYEKTPSGVTETEERIRLLIKRTDEQERNPVTSGMKDGVLTSPEEAQRAKEQQLKDRTELMRLNAQLPQMRIDEEKKRAEQEQKNNEETQKKKDEDASRSEKARLQSIIEDEERLTSEKEKAVLALAELEKKGKTEGEQKLIDLRAKQQIKGMWDKIFEPDKKPERFVPRALDVQTDSLARIGLLVGGQSPMAGDNHAKRGADSLEKMVKDGIIIRNLSRDWVN
jgi:hypothetical protein